MNIAMILEMAASGGDRLAVTAGSPSLTASGLLRLAHAAADRFQRYPAVLYLGANHLAYPVALFGAALAGVPFVPLNYRLGDQQLAGLVARHPGALVLNTSDLDTLIAPEDHPAAPRPSLKRTLSPCCSIRAGRPPSPRRRCCGTGI